MAEAHVAVPETPEALAGVADARLEPLHRIDRRRQTAQDCRGIPRTGPDFQHPVVRRQPQGFRHPRDDVGLRNCLAVADRERHVLIRPRTELRGHKGLPWHRPHGGQDGLVTNAPRQQLGLDHPVALLGEDIG